MQSQYTGFEGPVSNQHDLLARCGQTDFDAEEDFEEVILFAQSRRTASAQEIDVQHEPSMQFQQKAPEEEDEVARFVPFV